MLMRSFRLLTYCLLTFLPLSLRAQTEVPSTTNTSAAETQAAPENTAANGPATPPDSTRLIAIKAPKAIYPLEAVREKLQGQVHVRLSISETGEVESAELISGDKILGDAAIDAFKKWRFQPYFKGGKPVKVHATLPMDFAFAEKVMANGVSADRSTTTERPVANLPASSSPDDKSSLAAATSVQPTINRVRIGQNVSGGLLMRSVAPIYPDDARRMRIEGAVVLRAVIGKDGRIKDLKAISGSRELIPAAIGAVQQWQYRPYLLEGEPVEVDTQITVNFRLH